MRVVLTRPRSSCAALAAVLGAEGHEVEVVPAIRVEELAGGVDALAAALSGPVRYDWLAVTSANGARSLGTAMAREGMAPASLGVRVAAVGPATEAALSALGVRVDLVPKAATAASLAHALAEQVGDAAAETAVLFVTSTRGRPTLQAGLGGRGIDVRRIETYSTEPNRLTDRQVVVLCAANVVVLFSPSAAEAIAAAGPAAVLTGRLLCAGPTTAEAARRLFGASAEVIELPAPTDAAVRAAMTNAAG